MASMVTVPISSVKNDIHFPASADVLKSVSAPYLGDWSDLWLMHFFSACGFQVLN